MSKAKLLLRRKNILKDINRCDVELKTALECFNVSKLLVEVDDRMRVQYQLTW